MNINKLVNAVVDFAYTGPYSYGYAGVLRPTYYSLEKVLEDFGFHSRHVIYRQPRWNQNFGLFMVAVRRIGKGRCNILICWGDGRAYLYELESDMPVEMVKEHRRAEAQRRVEDKRHIVADLKAGRGVDYVWGQEGGQFHSRYRSCSAPRALEAIGLKPWEYLPEESVENFYIREKCRHTIRGCEYPGE